MKAVRLYGKEDLRVDDVTMPEAAAGELLIKVRATFICGTDLRMVANGNSGAEGAPVTLGHEVSGVIASVGAGVDPSYREGTRVAVAPNIGCGICDYCVSGNTQMCSRMQSLGITIDGGLAEFVRIPAAAVVQGAVSVLPEALSFEEAALVEPFSCVYNAFERVGAGASDRVLIIGAGPIGLMHAKLFRNAGVDTVMIHDLNPQRLKVCSQQDPSIVAIGPEGPQDAVRECSGGRGADVVITATPAPAAQVLALELAAVGGRVVFFGGLPKDREQVTLNTNIIHYKQITVTGTTRQNLRQFRICLSMVAAKRVDLTGVISRTYSLEQAAEAFEFARSGRGLKTGFVL